MVIQIKALACELPASQEVPLSRFSVADVARQAQALGLVATISDSTVWRWLNEDAIRLWHHHVAADEFGERIHRVGDAANPMGHCGPVEVDPLTRDAARRH